MRFLEIKDGFSIKIDSIEAIERINEFETRVHITGNTWTANFPFSTLLRILEEDVQEEPTMKKLDAVLGESQFNRI